MTQSEAIKVFEQRDIRSLWDDEAGADGAEDRCQRSA